MTDRTMTHSETQPTGLAMTTSRPFGLFAIALLLGVAAALPVKEAHAQQRQVRTYVPPDQLVSFPPNMPFDQFLEILNPVVMRMTGKEIIDPNSRDEAIDITVNGMHFLDALEMVLDHNGLSYRETERYFMVEELTAFNPGVAASIAPPRDSTGGVTGLPANMDTRQIEINAVLFELNHTEAKDSGIDWSVLFGSTGSTSSAGGGTQGGAGSENRLSFQLKTDQLFSPLDDIIEAPDQIDFADLNALFRYAEAQGVGETVASPNVTVQSGQPGDIQIGSDVPVQIRDTFGNISTQLFQTGIIIDVTPTFIEEPILDSLGMPTGQTVEFVHLNARIEKSNSRPSADGPIIDKTTVNTQAILLDGEQTVVGGLYSTDESMSRRGVVAMRPWRFGTVQWTAPCWPCGL